MEVIHISLSGELSSTCQNACIAAEEVGNVYVIDGRSLSAGSSHLALLAKELADAGMSAAEIVETVNAAKERLDVSFVLQTLEYLQKGGRCSGVAAFGANVMKLRPEIRVTDGKMDVGKKYRGSYERCIRQYVQERLEGRTDIRNRRIFLTHSHCSAETVALVRECIREYGRFDEIIETTAGCTISCHCGPGTLGILFVRK